MAGLQGVTREYGGLQGKSLGRSQIRRLLTFQQIRSFTSTQTYCTQIATRIVTWNSRGTVPTFTLTRRRAFPDARWLVCHHQTNEMNHCLHYWQFVHAGATTSADRRGSPIHSALIEYGDGALKFR